LEEFPQVLFEVGEKFWELIICLLDVLKHDFRDLN
jgi:hypothetical protein